jgi:hypothetical protein
MPAGHLLLAVFLVFCYTTGSTTAVKIPEEWKVLLELLGNENEGSLGCSTPIVRDLVTFPAVAAVMADSKVVLCALF